MDVRRELMPAIARNKAAVEAEVRRSSPEPVLRSADALRRRTPSTCRWATRRTPTSRTRAASPSTSCAP
jgi:hypothetical protein